MQTTDRKPERLYCVVNCVIPMRGDLYHIDCASDGGQIFVEADGSIAEALNRGDRVIFEGRLTTVRGVEFLEGVFFVGYWGAQR